MRALIKNIVVWILELEAKLVLRRFKPKVVAITGNVGKTTTKDMIYEALSGRLYVRKSKKSYNSEVGVPLTVLDLTTSWENPLGWVKNIFMGLMTLVLPGHYPKWLVLEMGVDKPGDMRRLTSYVKPDVTVISGMGSEALVHVEYFKTPEELIAEKAILIEETKPDGLVIINGDDERAMSMRSKSRARVITFGEGPRNDVVIERTSINYDEGGASPSGMIFHISVGGANAPIVMGGITGKGYMYAAAAAVAVGAHLGLNVVNMAEGFLNFEPNRGRGLIIDGLHGSTIIDESYNLSSAALKLALENLRNIKSSDRKIVMISDMTEIGDLAESEHKKAGTWIARSADKLITVGENAMHYHEGAGESGMSREDMKHFTDSKQAGEYLKDKLKAGDIVLVKGAQSRRMEKAAFEILARPDQAAHLLPRQEPEWLTR